MNNVCCWSMKQGLVERVAVIFFSEDNVPVERFIFKLTINPSCAALVEEGQLEFALRSFLIKLSVSKSLVKPLPQSIYISLAPFFLLPIRPNLCSYSNVSHSKTDCGWEVTAYLRSLPEVGSSKEGELWIPTDTKQWQKPPVITPVKSLNSEPLCLQLYLEHPSFSERQPSQAQWCLRKCSPWAISQITHELRLSWTQFLKQDALLFYIIYSHLFLQVRKEGHR